jgi:hypothetical protein
MVREWGDVATYSNHENVADGEYYYDSCYSSACALGSKNLLDFYHGHWLVDLGCSDHITPYLDDFSNLAQGEQYASTANGAVVKMTGPGTIVLQQDKLQAPPITLMEVWYAPEAAHCLLSVTALTNQGFRCEITDTTKIWNKQGHLVMQAAALLPGTSLHWFQSRSITPGSRVLSLQDTKSYNLWHYHLGHCSKVRFSQAHDKLRGIPFLDPPKSSPPCRGCQLGKAHEQAFPALLIHASRVLDLVHTNLYKMPTLSCSHNKWIITFIDDASGFAALHFLRSKADATRYFQDLVAWAETQTGYRLRSVHSDQGGEYINETL